MEGERIKKPFKIPYILIAINVAIFALIFIIDPSLSTSTLISFGAKYDFRIVEGEYFRLITTMFLHASIPHLLFNMIALNAFGRDLEIIFGKRKFLSIYFISGIVGSMGSFIFNDAVGVGASGAIFGLLGANLYLFSINPKAYKQIYGNDILVLIAINLAYGFMVPQIDNSAHLFGLIGGYLTSWAIGIRMEKLTAKKRYPFQAAIIGIFILFFTVAVPIYKNSWNYDLNKAVEAINSGNIGIAKEYLLRGQEKAPDNMDIEYLLDYLEQ